MVMVLEQNNPLAALGQATGQGLSTGLQMLVNEKLADMQAQKLLARGFTPREAQLWEQFTEGGKTHLAKEIVERLQREKGLQERGFKPQEVVAEEEVEEVGLTPKEQVGREEGRYKTNLPLYQEAQKKVKGQEQEGIAIQRLQELNEGGNLPKGLERWNVKFESGELRLPFLASADAQAFIKTINDFTTKAKDSFGARVTNFELNRFMKRLPQLLNTEDGRRVILRQMELLNQMNNLHDQATLDAFDSRGGVRKLDFDQAQRIGEKLIKPQIEELRKEYAKLDSGKLRKEAIKEKTLKKVEKGTPLTNEVVDDLLRKSAGDIEKAKELARKMGYEF